MQARSPFKLQDAQSSEIRKRDLELFDCRRACRVRLGSAGLPSLLYFGRFAEEEEDEDEDEEDEWNGGSANDLARFERLIRRLLFLSVVHKRLDAND